MTNHFKPHTPAMNGRNAGARPSINPTILPTGKLIAIVLAIGGIVADDRQPQLCRAGERWPAGSKKHPGSR